MHCMGKLRLWGALTVLLPFVQGNASQKVIIDHSNWNAETVDITNLDMVRMQKIIHLHRSVGSNIASGIIMLNNDDPTRYAITISHAPISPNRMDTPGFGHEHVTLVAGYPTDDPPQDRTYHDIDAFFQQMQSLDDYGQEWGNVVNIAEFNLGWSGIRRTVNIDSLFAYYIAKMESLMVRYPTCLFVHYTCNLKIEEDYDLLKEDNIARHLFNEKLRAYVDSVGGYLYDIADLQAHDDQGNLQTFEYRGSHYPELWYVPEDPQNDGWGDPTSHLNERGQRYTALAKWSLWVKMLNQVLPVELADFAARVVAGGIELNWTTLSETRNYGFEVERSTDGKNFQKIAFLKGSGSTTSGNTYRFLDRRVSRSIYYYRLKQIDLSREYQYVQIRISYQGPVEFFLHPSYPNPFSASTTISYSLPVDSQVALTVYDVRGQAVATIIDDLQTAGEYQVNWEGRDARDNPLPSGVYYVKMRALNFVGYQKLALLK